MLKHLPILPATTGLLLLLAGAAQAQTVTFAPVATYSSGPNSGPRGIAVGDLNSDGRPDIITGNYSGSVGILLNNGAGVFQAVVTYPTGTNSNPARLAIGDVNNDGKADIIVAAAGRNAVGVLLGNGNGTFQAASFYGTDVQPLGMTLGDINGDGRLDIITSNFTSGTVHVLLGTGSGTFNTATSYSTGINMAPGSGSTLPAGVTLSDVNLDGKPDVLVANYSSYSNTAGVLLGNGDGTLQAVVTYSTGSGTFPFDITEGDLSADGKPDIVTANSNRTTAGVLLGSGNGNFQQVVAYPTASTSTNGPYRPSYSRKGLNLR